MKKCNWLMILFYGCVAAAIGVALVSAARSQIENVVINNESLSDFSQGWQCFVDGEPWGEQTLPLDLKVPANTTVTFENTIPQELRQNSTLFFRTSQSFVKIYVGDHLLHSFGYDSKQAFGHSPGSAWQVMRIPIDDFGKPIRIELSSPYARYAGALGEVAIGSKAAIVFEILRQNLVGVVVSLFIFVSGSLMLIIYAFTKDARRNNALLYLGSFSLLLSVWTMGETKIWQLFCGNTFFLTNLVFLSLLLLPIPFLLFLTSFDPYREDRGIKLLILLFEGNFVLTNLLQITGIADYFMMLITVQMLIAAGILYLLWRFVEELLRAHTLEVNIISASVVILLVFCSLGFFSFFRSGLLDSMMYVSVGFLLFVLILGMWASQQALLSFSYRIEQKTLQSLAYTDILTKLNNRLAFEQRMDRYRGGEVGGAVLLMFDLNNLKILNDTISHKAGDQALLTVAGLLRESFADLGECYRIGGDEFCVICHEADDEPVAQAVRRFQEGMERHNQIGGVKLSVAYGSARAQSSEDVDAALYAADQAMYRCKRRMKRLLGNSRTGARVEEEPAQ